MTAWVSDAPQGGEPRGRHRMWSPHRLGQVLPPVPCSQVGTPVQVQTGRAARPLGHGSES